MPPTEGNQTNDPPSKPWTSTALAAGAVSLACLPLYMFHISKFADNDYKPDDTAALLAAFGHQDEFDARIGQIHDPVTIPAEQVKSWMNQPHPGGWRQTLQNLRHADVHPPAYFLLLRSWLALSGAAYPAAAALNAVIMALTIGILTAGALRYAGPAGLVPPLVFATSTGAFAAAMEIRPNALAAFGLAVAAVAAMPILNNRGKMPLPNLLAIASGSLIAGYAQYLSGPVIFILFALLAIRAWSARTPGMVRNLAFTSIATAIAFTPLLPTLSDQMARLQSNKATSKPAHPDETASMRWRDSAVCLALNTAAFPRPAGDPKSMLAAAILFTWAITALLLARRPRDAVLLAAVTIVAVALIPWLVQTGKLSPHVLRPKYYTGFATLLCTLGSSALASRSPRWIAVALAAVFVPLIALNLSNDKRPIKWSFTASLTRNQAQELATADVVLIQSIRRQRRLLVMPLAARTKDAATLVIGTNQQLQDLIKQGRLPDAPTGQYFYCSPYGESQGFRINPTP